MITLRRMRGTGHMAYMRDKTMHQGFGVLVRKPEGKRPLGRPHC
jgi:hypothetical protein